MTYPTGPACVGDCPTHGRLCEQDPGHDGEHDCPECPTYLRRQRAAQIAERVATHKALRDLTITPDED